MWNLTNMDNELRDEVIDMEKVKAFDLIDNAFSNWIGDYLWDSDTKPYEAFKCLAYIEGILHSVPDR